ncbi:MAG: AAA family ATPase [Clostridia bacterium]|nr:AAA family ATPase [Clostridia bacterium]
MSARDGKTYRLNVNGFPVEAGFSCEETKTVLDAVIKKIRTAHEENKNEKALRTVVYLSGPPGAGKSTLALSLIERAKESSFPYRMQCLGLDGFHLKSSVLKNSFCVLKGKQVLLNDVKGAPETFDQTAFRDRLKECIYNKKAYWPVYDRNIHDVSDEPHEVDGQILIVEGNWLLMSGIWAQAAECASLTVSLSASEQTLRKRLIERKTRGGKTLEEAREWFRMVDGPNAERYRLESKKSDIEIAETENGLRILSE